MTRRRTSSGVSPEKSLLRLPTTSPVAVSALPGRTALNETPLPRRCRELVRKNFSKLPDKLFAEFTGVHFHVAWAPPPLHEWNKRILPTGCSVFCRLSGSPQLEGCRACGPRQLARTLGTERDGHHFTCRLGVRNFWFPIRFHGETLGLAYLQALEHSRHKHTSQKRSARGTHLRPGREGVRVMSRSKFIRAARFLRLIVQHLQISSLADLRTADLTNAGRAVIALEKEQARLHETLKRHLPPTSQVHHRPAPKSRVEQIVHRLLERLALDHGKPVTLQQYARELGMNLTYLSDLFSRIVGVPFKTCLTEMRMEKAKELLGNPANNLSQIAGAVGYASENRFRSAFRKATGLSPKLWRETLQISPPPTAPSSA